MSNRHTQARRSQVESAVTIHQSDWSSDATELRLLVPTHSDSTPSPGASTASRTEPRAWTSGRTAWKVVRRRIEPDLAPDAACVRERPLPQDQPHDRNDRVRRHPGRHPESGAALGRPDDDQASIPPAGHRLESECGTSRRAGPVAQHPGHHRSCAPGDDCPAGNDPSRNVDRCARHRQPAHRWTSGHPASEHYAVLHREPRSPAPIPRADACRPDQLPHERSRSHWGDAGDGEQPEQCSHQRPDRVDDRLDGDAPGLFGRHHPHPRGRCGQHGVPTVGIGRSQRRRRSRQLHVLAPDHSRIGTAEPAAVQPDRPAQLQRRQLAARQRQHAPPGTHAVTSDGLLAVPKKPESGAVAMMQSRWRCAAHSRPSSSGTDNPASRPSLDQGARKCSIVAKSRCIPEDGLS